MRRMKSRPSYTILSASLFLLVLFGVMCKAKEKPSPAMVQSLSSATKGIAVVELFTSEGCSSCPPADAAVARLLSQKRQNVFVLGFHVDYWNRLGWTDAFSEVQFSERQREYAKALSLKSIYTPQVVVNGKTECVGSDEKRLTRAVDDALNKEPMANDLMVEAVRNGNVVTITYQTSQEDVVINAALVQPEAQTEVKRGENGGRVLHHVNVVRAFASANVKKNGSLTLAIPKEAGNESLQLIAYLQRKDRGDITAAQQKKL